MKLNVFHIILMILCLSALIISSETIKFYNRLDNFADFDLSLLSSKKRNEYLHDFYNKKYEESKILEKNIPKKYTPYQGYNTWNECNKVH